MIQAQVDKRLKELNSLQTGTETKFKSQRGGVEVLNRTKWPHEFVHTVTNKERGSDD